VDATGSAGQEMADDTQGAGRTEPEQDGALSYAGLPVTLNAATVDGLSLGQAFRQGMAGAGEGRVMGLASGFGQGAVRSLHVLPRTFSAQYGGGAGGALAVVSRAGAEGLHGDGYVLSRDSALAATNPFSLVTHYKDGVVTTAAVKPAGELTALGVAVGAPLAGLVTRLHGMPSGLRRATVFASVDAQLRDDQIVSTPAVGSFYALSAEQVALLGTRGVSAGATQAALNYLDSLTGTTARHAYRIQSFARVDEKLGGRDEMTLSYRGSRFDSPAGARLGQASDAVVALGTGSLGDSLLEVDAGMGRWLHVFSSRWNNEVRAQAVHDLEYETPHVPLAQEPAIGPGGYAPQVSIAPNGFAYGTPAALAATAGGGGKSAYPDEWREEMAESMQLRAGRHLLTLGGDWRRIDDRIAALTGGEGAFLYDSGTTGGKDGGLVDWITDYTFNVNAYPNGGCPSVHAAVHDFCFRTFTQSFGTEQTEFTTHEVAAFAEDALRMGRSLTATLGARWEYTLLPLPQNPNVALDQTLTGLGARALGAATNSFPEDRNNFGPRVGVVWAGPGKVTVRAGYGFFFGRLPGATVRAALLDTALPLTASTASTLHVRFTPTAVVQCPQITTVSQGFGYPCDFTGTPPAAVAATTSATVFAAGYRLPTVQRATLELERAVGRRGSVHVAYALALARQLPSSVDLNIAPATAQVSYVLQGGDGLPGLRSGETFAVPLYTQRAIAGYGPVTALVSDVNATYNAGEIEGRWAGAVGAGRLEMHGSYTFSRAIDYDPQSGATPRLNGRFDPFANGYDKGLSSQQIPQRFAGDVVFTVQVRSGPMELRRAVNGWHVGAIAAAGSGAPYSYQIFGGTRLTGGHETINGSGGATYLPTVGRNTLRLPPRGRVDLRVEREFGLGRGPDRRVRMSVSAEALNLTNTQSVSRVQTRAFLLGTPAATGAATPLVFQSAATIAAEGLTTTPAFGVPESSTTGLSRERQVELGVRVRF
jgi:hypothetical protein